MVHILYRFGGLMEIFDEKTYEKLSREYEKALNNSVLGALDRAIKGEVPFVLKKGNRENLQRCANLNNQLLEILTNLCTQRAESVKKLLNLNKKELPDSKSGEKLEISRYENPLIKIALELCLELEKIHNSGENVQYLLMRSYSILACVFSL